MNPIILKKELPGYLSDRLQEALWREALHIINEGYASTEDLDRAIEDGPGLRYSLMGTFLTCLLYTSPSPRDLSTSRMPSSA